MDKMSSDNGYELDSRPKGPVGKDEALRMEADALNKMQHKRKCKTKLHPSHVHVLPNSQATITPISQLEKDLIVFPDSEPKKGAEKDLFADIDVETLTNEELEKLLLDDNFGRPSSLLNRNISANTGGQTFSPYTANTSMLPISKSTVPNLTHLQGPVFPFQHVHVPGQQRPFLPYVSVQPVNPQVFHQPVMTPEMAKLFDKIASTSEYLRNGRSSVMDDNSVSVKSLEPVLHSTDSPSISRSDWLDLDPLSKHRVEAQENIGTLRGPVIVESVPANDPWDAVLREETEVTISNSYSTQEKDKCTVPPQPRRASTGIAVNKTHVPETSCLHKQSEQVTNESGTALKKYDILQENWGQNLEVSAFHEEIAKLKSKFSYDDPSTNPGYVLSPVISHREVGGDNSSSVKVSIEILDFQQPVTFTCDVSSPVELLIMQALCWAHDDLSQVDISSYVLKVCGQEQVLQNKHSLGSHEYVQNCRKWETEIQLQLLTHSTMKRDLARTEDDDASPIDLKTFLGDTDMPFKKTITRESLAEHLEEYHNQVNICLQKENTQYKAVDRIIQVVKNLCYLLDEVETPAITDAVRKLKRSVNLTKSCTSEGNGRSACSTNGDNWRTQRNLTEEKETWKGNDASYTEK